MEGNPGLQTVIPPNRGKGSLFSPPPEPDYPPIEALFDAPAQYYAGIGLAARLSAVRVLSECRWSPVAECRVTISPATGRKRQAETLIVKGCYRSDGARVAGLVGALWEASYYRQGEFRISEPVTYLEASRIFLQRPAAGTDLHAWLRRPRTGPAQARRAAAWLAHFHQQPIPTIPLPFHLREERGSLVNYRTALLQCLPGERRRLKALFAALEPIFATLSSQTGQPSGWTLTHGDYQPKNILIDGLRVTVIDFDRCALAPPARDVAYFAAQSLAMNGSPDQAQTWNAAFLSAYGRGTALGRGELSGGDVEASLPYYNAFFIRSLLEILFYKVFVMADPQRDFVPVFLDECERRLPA